MNYDKETRILRFSPDFNEELKDLPNDVENIIFDKWSFFNQEIKEGVLPYFLNTLKFGNDYDKKIKKSVLPPFLQTLDLGNEYNHELEEGLLPQSLHTLKIGCNFQNNIVIPEKTKEIYLWSHNNLINNLPNTIEKVYIKFSPYLPNNKNIENLPITVKKIIINREEFKRYLIKIPFDCEVEVIKF